MPKIKHDADGKPEYISFGSDEEVPRTNVPDEMEMVQFASPSENDKPIAIAVVITRTFIGWSFSVKSGPAYVYESKADAEQAVADWLRHWADTGAEVSAVRTFHPPNRFIANDGSVPGG